MAQSESETVLTEHHETDNLDPRTDAPARPGTPVHIAPVQYILFNTCAMS